MEEQIVIGDRVVQVGADGKPERVVEVCGVLAEVPGAIPAGVHRENDDGLLEGDPPG